MTTTSHSTADDTAAAPVMPASLPATEGGTKESKAADKIGGRALKMRSDGVAYTETNKMIAVHYAFAGKKRKLEEALSDLACGRTALYRWKSLFPVAAGKGEAVAGSKLAMIMELIMSRSDAENLAEFRRPTFAADASQHSSLARLAPTSAHSASASSSSARADGLGPAAEDSSVSGVQPGMLSALLQGALRRIEDAPPITDEELRSVCVSIDTDVDKAASAFVEESVNLGVRLKDQNLKDSTKALWQPHQRQFVAWWRALNKLRARTDAEGWRAEKEDVMVSEQKLLTWLNCYVLFRNPTLQYESVRTCVKAIKNLWEFQVALGKNPHPAPDGHLVHQYLKAINLSRAAQSRLRGDNKFTNTLKDGYDVKGLGDISRWFMLQTADRRRQAVAARDRFSFLWQHAIVGRSEDLRERELSDFYVCELPNSKPQPCPIIVSTQLSSKTNKEARPERGVAARYKDPEVCAVGALAAYLFSRFHCQGEAPPDFSSREAWYRLKLLVGDDRHDHTTPITYDSQAALLRLAFLACAIVSSSLTHAMRKGGSRIAYEAGCTEDAVRKHGRWCGDRMMERYLIGVAIQPVLALVGFKIEGGDYWLPRALLEPPQDLLETVFPWLEAAQAKIQARVLVGGESDSAALEFLSMLKFLRVVILQDAAVLYDDHPTYFLFSHAPFNTPSFAAFRAASLARIQTTPTPFETSLEQLMATVCHALAALRAVVEQVREVVSAATKELQDTVLALDQRQQQQHAEVMSAIQSLALTAPGSARNSEQHTRIVQSAMAESVRALLNVWQNVQTQTSSASSPLPAPASTAALLSVPPAPVAVNAADATQVMRALNLDALSTLSASKDNARPYSLPLLRTAAELLEEWTVGRDGREALKEIKRQDDVRFEHDKTTVRRFQMSSAIKQQIYRWNKVVCFVLEVSTELGQPPSRVATLLDEQVQQDKGKLPSPLRTMSDLLTDNQSRNSLFLALSTRCVAQTPTGVNAPAYEST